MAIKELFVDALNLDDTTRSTLLIELSIVRVDHLLDDLSMLSVLLIVTTIPLR